MRGGLLQTIADSERATTAANVGAGGFIRKGTLLSFDHASWKAVVQIGSLFYIFVDVDQSIREDLLVVGALCVVLVENLGYGDGAVIISTYGARPAPRGDMDTIKGHSHRPGVPGDGAPVSHGDLLP